MLSYYIQKEDVKSPADLSRSIKYKLILDSTWFNLTQLDLTQLFLSWLDLTQLERAQLDSTWLDLTWFDVTRRDSTWLYVTRRDSMWLDVTWLDFVTNKYDFCPQLIVLFLYWPWLTATIKMAEALSAFFILRRQNKWRAAQISKSLGIIYIFFDYNWQLKVGDFHPFEKCT